MNTHLDKIRTVYSIMEKHGIQPEFYTALNFADEIAHMVADLSLEDHARTNEAVRTYAESGRKINAIKELRSAVPGTGLKEAKEAVEAVYGSINSTTIINNPRFI